MKFLAKELNFKLFLKHIINFYVPRSTRKETWLYLKAKEVRTEGAIVLLMHSKKDAAKWSFKKNHCNWRTGKLLWFWFLGMLTLSKPVPEMRSTSNSFTTTGQTVLLLLSTFPWKNTSATLQKSDLTRSTKSSDTSISAGESCWMFRTSLMKQLWLFFFFPISTPT